MSIPLIQKPEKDDINASIIAIKRNIERINMLLGLVDSGSDPDLSGLATKQELQDAVTSLNEIKLGAENVSENWGMATPEGAVDVPIRTTSSGILPYESGERTSGHSDIGSTTWYFRNGYIQKVWVDKLNLNSTAGTENGDIWII